MRNDHAWDAGQFEAREVERNRPQRLAGDVHEMAARHVLRLARAGDEDLPGAGIYVEHRDLRRLDAAGRRRNREQHGTAARQVVRPEVIGLPALAIGPRQHLRRATRGRHTLQTGLERSCRDENAVVIAPGGAAARTVEARYLARRPARECNLAEGETPAVVPETAQGAYLEVADPLPVGRGKRILWQPSSRQRRGLELIEAAHE